MFIINEELKKLPAKPGVYIMRDKDDTILYIGKAVSLKNRVTQYFRKTNKTIRIQRMVSLIDHFEYIVTDNEAEALILECNLIKQNMPKFNVLLKDDKTYPYIKIDTNSDYPNVYITRRLANDGAKYFGPYANSGAAKEMVGFIKQKFKIRQCKTFKSNKRECLNYHINKCLGPCANLISKEEYNEQISQIIMLLEGKIDKIIKQIKVDIEEKAANQEYEKAADLRDRMIAIQQISERQKVSNINENSIDVIGMYRNSLEVCIEIFFVRNSKMIGREHYFYNNLKDMSNDEILSEFIKQYYLSKIELPNKIMVKENFEDKQLLEEYLCKKANKKVEFKIPKKGEKLKFIEMAENNAKITLENKNNAKLNILNELKEKLNLNEIPRKIETFDISNISGTNIVAGMCVAKDGVINRNLSRRFKIKTVYNQDDPKCMEETITRRMAHSINNKNDGFGELPNIILVDGGITQIKAAKKATDKYNINIPVFGMVKDNKHRTKALITEKREEIDISEDLKNFITLFQDEVHNTAIQYHRKLRQKEMTVSALDKIKGIGSKKREILLKKFGSIENIKKASIEELCEVKGINLALAKEIKQI